MTNYTVKPHESLPGYYDCGEWSFSIAPEDDGDLEFVDRAILSWQAWREFLANRETEETQTPLF